MAERKGAESLVAISIAIVIGALISWAGSDGSAQVGTLPVFALCGALAFVINWLAFVPAAMAKAWACQGAAKTGSAGGNSGWLKVIVPEIYIG